jgi:WD40 repeat protein
MAVGEAGYNPRVLLYSTTDDALCDIPVSIVSDHAFGLKCVAFSPDSRYLATLGHLNDGYLFVWAINQRTGSLTLHSANKCTTNICQMTWCGQYLVTVGTRFVKIWSVGRPARSTTSRRISLRPTSEEVVSPGPATLSGRNALLGSLVDCIFTSAVAIDHRLVILGADTGHLCAIEVADGSLEVKVLKVLDFGVTSISWQFNVRRLAIGGRYGIHYEHCPNLEARLPVKDTLEEDRPRSPRKGVRSSSIQQSLELLQPESAGVSALACLTSHTISLNSDGNLHLITANEDDSRTDLSFACHNDLIQGVQKMPAQCNMGTFFTWSRRGEIRFWDTGGALLARKLFSLDQQAIEDDAGQNELRVVRYISSTKQFVCGDRFGIVKLIEGQDWSASWTGRAHGAELSDATVHEDWSLVATCGRDRMVQLFKVGPHGLDLIQTLDDHIGAVTQVLFTVEADKLLSCSADRTVVVRDRAAREVKGASITAYLSARVITLRSTPLSMTFFDSACSNLLVSTSDRHMVRVEVPTGAIVESSKIIDPENDDTVVLSSLRLSAKGSLPEESCNLLAAYSSTDKSIRVYDANKSILLTRESGHTEGISDLCLIEQRDPGSDRVQRVLISTGLDGTIMIWNIVVSPLASFTPVEEVSQAETMLLSSDGTPVKQSPASLPPLRKLLSKMDAIEFTRSPGIASPPSLRSLSPPRLTRKRSQLAMTATIEEKEEEPKDGSASTKEEDKAQVIEDSRRSPSPPPAALNKLKKQRSRLEMSSETRAAMARRSPSPPPMSLSTPTTPRHRTVANNSRLRRPPSVPTDLRGQPLAQSRRQSMSQVNEFGSMGMATEQACRMLRTYRKKLMASKEDLGLDELEDELDLIMKLVRARKEKSAGTATQTPNGRKVKAMAATENELDDLVALLDRTNMAERSPQSMGRQGVGVKG